LNDDEAYAREAFSSMLLEWSALDVYKAMNMGEGIVFSNFLWSLGMEEQAFHVLREVWKAEDSSDRGPQPWSRNDGAY